MDGIPVLAFVGYSGVGKTTLLEKLVTSLKARGLRLAVVKHDGHEFAADCAFKDSWRFTQAGADVSVICSAGKMALVERGPISFARAAAAVGDVDLILAEGFKGEPLTQIGLCRPAAGKALPAPPSRYAAIVTDAPIADSQVPQFSYDDIPDLTAFLLEGRETFTRFVRQGPSEGILLPAPSPEKS